MLKFDIVSWFVALDLAILDYTHIIKVAGNYMFKVNNRNTRTRCEICSTLTIKIPERRRSRSGIFVINFEHISHLVLVYLLLTLNMYLPAGEACSPSLELYWMGVKAS